MAKSSAKRELPSSRYDLYDELDRLEELLEDMIGHGVSTIEDVEQRIRDLDAEIERLEAETD